MRSLFILEADLRYDEEMNNYTCAYCRAKGDKDEDGRWLVTPIHDDSCVWKRAHNAMHGLPAERKAKQDGAPR